MYGESNVAVKSCPIFPLLIMRNFWSDLLVVDFTPLEDVYLVLLICWVGVKESFVYALQAQANVLTVQAEIFSYIQNWYLQIIIKFQLLWLKIKL